MSFRRITQQCCWTHHGIECPELATRIFQPVDPRDPKGKGYCDKHYEMVQENRHWLIEQIRAKHENTLRDVA